MGEREGGTNGESSMETYTLPYVKQIASGNLLYQGTQTRALRKPKGMGWGGSQEGVSRGRGRMYTHG